MGCRVQGGSPWGRHCPGPSHPRSLAQSQNTVRSLSPPSASGLAPSLWGWDLGVWGQDGFRGIGSTVRAGSSTLWCSGTATGPRCLLRECHLRAGLWLAAGLWR